jgi:NADPH:quinone reductase-like Zn-dependent oxidoreductase
MHLGQAADRVQSDYICRRLRTVALANTIRLYMALKNKKNMKTVLITGASSGIGLELANVYAENGYDLFLTARREGNLKDLKKAIEKSHQEN